MIPRQAREELSQAFNKAATVASTVLSTAFKWAKKATVGAFLMSATTSTIVCKFPDTVSTPLNEYMAERGYPGDYQDHFTKQDMRVYERNSILYPFHKAGMETGMRWDSNVRNAVLYQGSLTEFIVNTLLMPVSYIKSLTDGFDILHTDRTTDAYAIMSGDRNEPGFIRPMAEISAQEFTAAFTSIAGHKFYFLSEPEQLAQALYQMVMLHEARHLDQDHDLPRNSLETDADLYAFKVLEARGGDKMVLTEAYTLLTHIRALAAIHEGDFAHVSGMALRYGNQTLLTSYEDQASAVLLSQLISEARVKNSFSLPLDMNGLNRDYFLTVMMWNEGCFNNNAAMKKTAETFTSACLYFDMITGGKLLMRNPDLSQVDVSFLLRPVNAAQDRSVLPQRIIMTGDTATPKSAAPKGPEI